MIGWLAIAVVALLALGIGLLLLRQNRGLWTLLASILVFGLAGYAWQGSPDLSAAPAQARDTGPRNGSNMVDIRREFFDPADLPTSFVTVADGFAHKGNFERSAQILQEVVAENPNNGEAWLALSIALVEHGEGRVAKPAEYALAQARTRLEGNPGPAFFEGVNALRRGQVLEARQIWAAGLKNAKDDAPGRVYIAERIAGLDQMMATIAQQQAEAADEAPQKPSGE